MAQDRREDDLADAAVAIALVDACCSIFEGRVLCREARPSCFERSFSQVASGPLTRLRGLGLRPARASRRSLARQRRAHRALAVRLHRREDDLADAAVAIALVDALADFQVNRPTALAAPARDLVDGRVDGVEVRRKRKELVDHGHASPLALRQRQTNEDSSLGDVMGRGFSNPVFPRAAHGAVVTLSPLARKPASLRLGTFPHFRSVRGAVPPARSQSRGSSALHAPGSPGGASRLRENARNRSVRDGRQPRPFLANTFFARIPRDATGCLMHQRQWRTYHESPRSHNPARAPVEWLVSRKMHGQECGHGFVGNCNSLILHTVWRNRSARKSA